MAVSQPPPSDDRGIQPFACLLAADLEEGTVTHISRNSAEFLGADAETLLGRPASEVLSEDIWHAVRGTLGRSNIQSERAPVGPLPVGSGLRDIGLFTTDNLAVIELEAIQVEGLQHSAGLRLFNFMVTQILSCQTQAELLEDAVRILRHMTGFDRALFCQVQAGGTEIVAQDCHIRAPALTAAPTFSAESLARESCLADSESTPVPILMLPSANRLDLSLALAQVQTIRTDDPVASYSVPILAGDRIWGVLALQHLRPRVPTAPLRDVLKAFAITIGIRLASMG